VGRRRSVPRTAKQLSPEERAEVSDRYWQETEPSTELMLKFNLSQGQLLKCVNPIPASEECGFCGGATEFRNRSQRADGSGTCVVCGHHDGSTRCHCASCAAVRHEHERQEKIEQAERLARRRREFWSSDTDAPYVRWALGRLTAAQRLYLDSLKRAILGPERLVHYEWVARAGGQDPRHVGRWLRVLERYRLIGFYDNVVDINPGLIHLDVLRPTKGQRAVPKTRP
jgi:hypothetical protein